MFTVVLSDRTYWMWTVRSGDDAAICRCKTKATADQICSTLNDSLQLVTPDPKGIATALESIQRRLERLEIRS